MSGGDMKIERVRAIVEKSLTRVDSTLDYPRTIEALTLLGNVVNAADTDEDTWSLGECGYSLDSLIVGAYWHLSEWHGGQWSESYAALCSLGNVFSPGMTSGPEPDSCEMLVYQDLETMAKSL